MRFSITVIVLLASIAAASARDLTVATWNLGWHMDRATVADWIAACETTYIKDPAGDTWAASESPDAKKGWDIDVFQVAGWDTARLPVCNVYRGRDFKVIPVTVPAYEKRLEQIGRFINANIAADVIAFEEVSGKAAVEQSLEHPDEYNICSFTGFKVQRLAIAWRKELGSEISCETEDSLALSGNPPDQQPRPGLTLTLDIAGKSVAFLAVHLKSSCVSPFEGKALEPAGSDRNCRILRQQVPALESWIEREGANVDHVVLLGDFNRNFWHEANDTQIVRGDGTAPTGILSSATVVNSLFEEVNDGHPETSSFALLEEHCDSNDVASLLCKIGEMRRLDAAEIGLLSSSGYLGCRNPIGLDHILLGPGVNSETGATHVSIGVFGGSKAANSSNPNPLLAISDHCPLVARISFPDALPPNPVSDVEAFEGSASYDDQFEPALDSLPEGLPFPFDEVTTADILEYRARGVTVGNGVVHYELIFVNNQGERVGETYHSAVPFSGINPGLEMTIEDQDWAVVALRQGIGTDGKDQPLYVTQAKVLPPGSKSDYVDDHWVPWPWAR